MTKLETAAERAEREVEILAGEIPVDLSDGRRVVVREIRWGESLRLGAQLRSIIAEVARKASGKEVPALALFEIPEDHPEEFFWVLSLVTGLPVAELEGLPLEDGEVLEAAFWRQNTSFFARQVGRILRAAPTEDQPEAPAISTRPLQENSSPPSSASDTTPES